MLYFKNNGRLVQSIDELPSIQDIENLYLDFETTSEHPKLDSLNPWHHCKPAGYAFTFDDLQEAYYVPWNIPNADIYLSKLIYCSTNWINHNVKYDAHVYGNNCCDTFFQKNIILIDTVVGSKLIDSNLAFRGGYSLDNCARIFLDEEINEYEEKLKPYLIKNKDYGRIPADILGEYACQDVLTNRRLYKYIKAKMPSESQSVWQTEIKLTSILYEMEIYGMHTDVTDLKKIELISLYQLLQLEEELKVLTGRKFRPHTNEDCFEVLCGQYGLPIVEWTDALKPSFGKTALAAYSTHPYAPKDVVKKIIEYRKIYTTMNFFITPYQELAINDILHPSYNQCLRTGRLSCSEPNMQQLNKAAKALITPRKGNAFLSCDLSQIEFRIIVHYIQNAGAISAYQHDPDTDFHQWVANMCGIARRPAKTCNFMMGYGGGKRKTVAVLSKLGDVIADIEQEIIEDDIQEKYKEYEFKLRCEKRGLRVYNEYHDTLPELKPTSRHVAAVAYSRGFVRNLYGRRRNLPPDKSHIGFNTICQSTAADLMKERTVALHELIKSKNWPIHICASVHDETLMEAPIEVIEDRSIQCQIVKCIESPSIPMRVPVRSTAGISRLNWKEACSDDIAKTIPISELSEFSELERYSNDYTRST